MKKQSKKGGRPVELDAAIQSHLCELLESAVPIAVACEASGISASTYHNWRARGESGEERFVEFLDATARARSRAKQALLRIVQTAAERDWRAAGWLLNHMIPPKEWSDERPPEKSVQVSEIPDFELSAIFAKLRDEDEQTRKQLKDALANCR